MWPRNAAVACKRSRTCKRAKENITRLTQPMGLSQQHESRRLRRNVVFRIAPAQLLLRPFPCPLARVTLPFRLRHQRSQHG
jgi:hypothetical protein